MEGIRNTFTQKFGPLPVWLWAALILAGLVGYWFFTKTGPFASSSGGSTSGAPSSDSTNQTDNALSSLMGSMTADLQALANRGQTSSSNPGVTVTSGSPVTGSDGGGANRGGSIGPGPGPYTGQIVGPITSYPGLTKNMTPAGGKPTGNARAKVY